MYYFSFISSFIYKTDIRFIIKDDNSHDGSNIVITKNILHCYFNLNFAFFS